MPGAFPGAVFEGEVRDGRMHARVTVVAHLAALCHTECKFSLSCRMSYFLNSLRKGCLYAFAAINPKPM